MFFFFLWNVAFFDRGHAFQRLLQEREIEIELDNKDRAKEKEELEELRNAILAEGHDDPDEAYRKVALNNF